MLNCPNINTKEWKDLVAAIGEREAFREYMKLGTGEIPMVDEYIDMANAKMSKLDGLATDKLLQKEVAEDLMDFLSIKFPGIKGQVINDKSKRWKGRVLGNNSVVINTAYAQISDGFHEYAHPFLMSLRKSNQELFDNLWDDLLHSKEWDEIETVAINRVRNLYPELLEKSVNLDNYKEEVMATAIGYAAEIKVNNYQKKISGRLQNFIDNVFKWIKSFMADFFMVDKSTINMSVNTTFGDVVEMFTDKKSRILLDNNWMDVIANMEKADAAANAKSIEVIDLQEDLKNDLTAALSINKAFTLDEYISDWIDRKFKLPKAEYKPRKVSSKGIAYDIAQKMLETATVGLGTRIRTRKISDSTMDKLAQVLKPIELNYKYSNILKAKGKTLIALTQPFVIIKDISIKDKQTGEERNERKANINVSLDEAEAITYFQNFVKEKFPGRKSIAADELNDLYLDWVTQNFGINYTEATGHTNFGMSNISNATPQNYTRVLFMDDHLVTSISKGPFHTFNINNTNAKGNGLGWYAKVLFNNDRLDHEFQSDILPEIAKSEKEGEYKMVPSIKNLDRRAMVSNQAENAVSKTIYFQGDIALLRVRDIRDIIMDPEGVYDNAEDEEIYVDPETLIDDPSIGMITPTNDTIDIDLPFSKIEEIDAAEFDIIHKTLLSELNVAISATRNNSQMLPSNIYIDKIYSKVLNLFLGRKNEDQTALYKWFKTLRFEKISDRDETEIDLPFSKLEQTPIYKHYLPGNDGRIEVYLTEESYKTIPEFAKKMLKQNNEWAKSNAIIKPYKEISEADIARDLGRAISMHLINFKDLTLKKNYGRYRTVAQISRNNYKSKLDKYFGNYRKWTKQIKSLEFRKDVYANKDNVIKIISYYRGQFKRLYKFYNSVYADGKALAEKQVKKQTEQPENPLYNIYNKYANLYYKWFSIIIPQSINSAKAEGRTHYYLPTAEAMNAIEGNPRAEDVYWSPHDEITLGESRRKQKLLAERNALNNIERYILTNNQETANDIRSFLAERDLISRLNPGISSREIAELLFENNFNNESEDFQNWVTANPQLLDNTLPAKANGPFFTALKKYADKNNIKLSFEKPEWSKHTLIRVDLTGYTIKPIDRFSKIDESNLTFEPKEIPLPTPEVQKAYKGEEIAVALAGQISLNTGVPFKIVTPEEALRIDPNYAGQKSFYVNGVTYFLAGKMSMDNVIHEFAHPFVDAIYATNPELFNKLYSDLINTAEGDEIMKEVDGLGYTTDRDDPNYRKEVLVRAMTKEAMNNTNDIKNSTGFKDFIKKFLFAIKQALRKVFGSKVKIEKLSTNTSLAELADMLKSDKFDIDTELVSEKDFVAYARDVSDFLNALAKVEKPDESINPLIHKFFRMVRNQINLVKSPKYAKASEVVSSKKATTSLEKIAAFLQITPEIDEPQKQFYDEVKILEKNTFNFIHAVLKLDELLDAVNDHIDVIKTEKDPKLVLSDIYYYSIVTRNWQKFINEATEVLTDNGLSLTSQFGRILGSMNEKSKLIARKSTEAYIPGLVEMYSEILAPLSKGIDDFYSSQIKKIQKDADKGNEKAKKEIERLEKEWDNKRINETKIKDYLLGNIADTNEASPWLESYITNPDPITSGFALITKNAKSEVNYEALKNTNDFVNALEPLLTAAGYTRYNFVKLMKQISFIDNDMTLNPETGELEQTPRKSFLHEFQNMDAFLRKSQYDYERAIESGDQSLADQILSDRRQHLKDYFHQPYAAEYYEREDVYATLDKNLDLEDAVYGIMGVDKSKANNDQKAEAAAMYQRAAQNAYRARHEILNQIKQEDALSGDDLHREDAIESKKQLWRDFSRLSALRDKNGDPKFGEDLLSALIERKYRKESKKFFDWVPIEGEFELALDLYEQSLIDQGIKPKLNASDPDGEFETKRAKWIKNNTIIKYKPKFYEERNAILIKLRNALSKLPDEVRNNIDSTSEMEELLDLVTGFRDENGQVIGDDLSNKTADRVRILQEEILKKRNIYAGYSGLTKSEMETFNYLFGKRKSRQPLTKIEEQELSELFAKKSRLGIDLALQSEIRGLFAQLADIQSKEATDYYVEVMNHWLGQMGEPMIDSESANDLLEPQVYTKLFSINKEFEKWFKKNHILKEKWIPNPNQKGDGETILVYERLFHWSKTVPNDKDYIETTKLSNGELIMGVPNRAYYERIVLPDYLTDKIVGKTTDNKGNWLPKTIADGAKLDSPYINKAYEELRKSDPAAFAVLEKVKEFYLKFQSEMLEDSRLYMKVPRFRNMAVENARAIGEITKDKAKGFWLGLRNLFIKTDDNYEEGLSFNPAELVNVDMFNEETRKVPVRGLYNLKPQETSDNFLDSIIRYMHSGLEQKKLVEMNYFAQALKDVLENPKNGIVKTKSWVKWEWLKFKRRVPTRSKKMSQRAKNVSNFYAREYLGENTTGVFSDYESFWKTKNTISSIMSLGLFGLNLNSALKGREATIIQTYIESTSGRFLDPISYLKGWGRAELMMLENSTQIYATKNKSLNVQLMQIFDPGQEFLSKSIERQFGRSLVSDIAGFSNILMAPRKYLQFGATLKVMTGMLYHIQVEQTEGTQKRKIDYINAFEVRNGIITLKSGIDPDYGPEKVVHKVIPGETAQSIADKYFITKEELLKRAKVENESEIKEGMEIKVGDSRKFLEVKNQIHEVNELLEGSYSKISRSELDRTILGSATRYMKKYFAPMFMNWFGFARPNAAIGGMTMGNYTAFFRVLKNILKFRSKGWMWSNPQEIQGFNKSVAQLAMLIFHYWMLAHIFGYDPDDKKRFKRMKKREREGMFSAGWAFNAAAALHYSTMLETETFNIWLVPSGLTGGVTEQTIPGPLYLGKTLFKLPEQAAFTMAASSVIKIAGYGAMGISGEEQGFYQKDEGPYWYQKEGAAKVFNIVLGNIFGFTGDFVSPAKAMEKQEEGRRRIGF